MRFDIRRRHSLCVHRQDFLFDVAAQRGLLLLDQFRLELALPIPRNLELHVPVARFQRLFAVTVAAVVRLFVPVIVLRVAEFFVQLAFQSLIHKFSDHFSEQFVDLLHGLDSRSRHQRPELLPERRPLRGDLSLRHTPKPPCRFILPQLRGLHKMRDGLQSSVSRLSVAEQPFDNGEDVLDFCPDGGFLPLPTLKLTL